MARFPKTDNLDALSAMADGHSPRRGETPTEWLARIDAQYGEGRIYDGRPAAEALSRRLRRDRLSGELVTMVKVQRGLRSPSKHRLIVAVLLDADGEPARIYRTQRSGRIQAEGVRMWGADVLRKPRDGELTEVTDPRAGNRGVTDVPRTVTTGGTPDGT